MSSTKKNIVTDEMVNRFLSWALPGDFYPDGGIHFTAPNSGAMPTGTNLLHAGQARAMLEHILQPTIRATDCLTFGLALEALKAGKRIARAGWNGKGMWLCLSPGRESFSAVDFWAPANRDYALSQGGTAKVLPSISMTTAAGEIQMGWLASQSDMLAEDWRIVE